MLSLTLLENLTVYPISHCRRIFLCFFFFVKCENQLIMISNFNAIYLFLSLYYNNAFLTIEGERML